MTVTILLGDCRAVLKTMQPASVHTCVTYAQLGLEPTPQEFVDTLVNVFRDVRRVLRDDGTLWLNLGDSYNNARSGGHGATGGLDKSTLASSAPYGVSPIKKGTDVNLKSKDLLGIPWRVAFALQADGWYLRQDIIWHKPNPMPESVTDRCTKAHEYVFMLSKSPTYYFDHEAIKEDAVEKKSGNSKRKAAGARGVPNSNASNINDGVAGSIPWAGTKRNKRSVWTVAPEPFKEAHFATFPPALIEPCILAGCPASGTVLDPFGGAGTTALVAERLGRNSTLIELNPEYVQIACDRLGLPRRMPWELVV